MVFVDGSNWYHALREAGVPGIGRLDYRRISLKLVGSRGWAGTRYYVGGVRQRSDPRLYADQRRFLERLRRTDPRITVHLGRLETRNVESRAARELLAFVSRLSIRIDPEVRRELLSIGRSHLREVAVVEKAVDVMLAVDLVVMAERDRLDTAYVLSTDGDFTPAVTAAQAAGRKVIGASPGRGVALQSACDAFIRLPEPWFEDCYRDR